ncbi:MAG TPA: respiratory nitrate reductase subunit gamma [Propionibacterium sp.]|jgi:nitrate reductase gamma subunit|nr:respiratory nitrate reductase subunit gamma [Propionibacterium sp.]
MTTEYGALDIILWGVLPYVTIAMLIGGTIWRWRYDQFGWTTRSSQLYEGRWLRIASPLFHFGVLVVVVGHAMGLLIPKRWTDAIGISQHTYHLMALSLGALAGICTLIGVTLLVIRRRTTGPVFQATTANDKFMYIFLVGAIVMGLLATFFGTITPAGEAEHNYRETVSIWFRSLFVLQPAIGAMAQATTLFKIHNLVGMILFAIWPFTRLIHAFSAPLGYVFRPYVVYRSADKGRPSGSSGGRRGWEPIGTPDRERRRTRS